ncbi:MAG: carboxypeptidase regulatory-like domain-containing protein [Actinobacteria bacterium]|nr:carboxypeptidase regulatory-like domain-containing protein [Actinomycetota bacterium]
MKNHRAILLIALAIIVCLALGGITLANAGSVDPTGKYLSSQLSSQSSTSMVSSESPRNDIDSKEGTRTASIRFGKISGLTVLDTTSTTTSPTLLAHVHLRLVRDGKICRAAQSNKEGAFIFKNIKAGNYTLVAWAKDAKLASKNATSISGGNRTTLTINGIRVNAGEETTLTIHFVKR